MELVRFAGLILSILLVLHAFRDSSALADQQGRKMKGNMVMGRKKNISPAAFVSSAVVAGKEGLGGRKMVTKIEDLLGKGLKGESPKKSETDKNASKESLGLGGHQHHFNNQNGKVLEAKTTDLAQKDESYRVMEADDREVMNIMRKDYKGMNKPCRKPPINNHKPTD